MKLCTASSILADPLREEQPMGRAPVVFLSAVAICLVAQGPNIFSTFSTSSRELQKPKRSGGVKSGGEKSQTAEISRPETDHRYVKLSQQARHSGRRARAHMLTQQLSKGGDRE